MPQLPDQDREGIVAFLDELFEFASGDICIVDLPTQQGKGQTFSRLVPQVGADRWDGAFNKIITPHAHQIGRAVYFCVAALDPEAVKVRMAEAKALGPAGDGRQPRAKETILEGVALFADVDFKGILVSEGEIIRRLDALEIQPSFVVHSGNGLHLYWKLNEVFEFSGDKKVSRQQRIAEWESYLKRIAHIVGGDLSVCEAARVLRLPYSLNSKTGAGKPVKILRQSGVTYDLEEIKDWLGGQEPIITEDERVVKTKKAATAPVKIVTVDGEPVVKDPFEAAYEDAVSRGLIRSSPMDIQGAFAGIVHGDGEHGVHVTIRSIAAHLTMKGLPRAECLEIIMEGMEKWVLTNGNPWGPDWQRIIENKANECVLSAERKFKEQVEVARAKLVAWRAEREARAAIDGDYRDVTGEEIEAEVRVTGTDAPNVSFFRAKTMPKIEAGGDKDDDKNQHMKMAEWLIAYLETRGEFVRFWQDRLHHYEGGLWVQYRGDKPDEWMSRRLEEAYRALDEAAFADWREKGEIGKPPNPISRNVAFGKNVIYAIKANPDLEFRGQWDDHECIPLKEGLFDPRTKKMRPYTPQDNATSRLAIPRYDPAAKYDILLQMIERMFESYDDAEKKNIIDLIQEYFYVAICLSGREIGRDLRQALYFKGKARSGKSEIVKIMQLVFGRDNFFSASLAAISDSAEGRFAMQSFIGKKAWLVEEAGDENTRISAIRFKDIFSEGTIQIDVKNSKPEQFAFYGTGIFASNSLPRSSDGGSGFVERLNVVTCIEYFDPENLEGVALMAQKAGFSKPHQFVFAKEASGILNWALGAKDRVERTGRFTATRTTSHARDVISDLINPVQAFAKECLQECEITRGCRSVDVYDVYQSWYIHNNKRYGMKPAKTFYTLLNQCFEESGRGRVGKEVVRIRNSQFIAGLIFNENGIDEWRAIISSDGHVAGEKILLSPNISKKEEELVEIITAPKDIEALQKHFGAGRSKKKQVVEVDKIIPVKLDETRF